LNITLTKEEIKIAIYAFMFSESILMNCSNFDDARYESGYETNEEKTQEMLADLLKPHFNIEPRRKNKTVQKMFLSYEDLGEDFKLFESFVKNNKLVDSCSLDYIDILEIYGSLFNCVGYVEKNREYVEMGAEAKLKKFDDEWAENFVGIRKLIVKIKKELELELENERK
jgi:hypothetical protein